MHERFTRIGIGAVLGSAKGDALVMTVGAAFQDIQVGYSYDAGTGAVGNLSPNTHEITVSYVLPRQGAGFSRRGLGGRLARPESDHQELTMNMFKNFALCFGAFLLVGGVSAQFKGLVVEEIDNKGLVPGKTYRIYAQMEAEGDVVDAIFGDGEDYLEVKSTAPFFQHERGGNSANELQRADVAVHRRVGLRQLGHHWL